MRRTVDVISMGCSKNLVDSEKLLYQLRQNGFRVAHNPSRMHHDTVVVNTCGFIGDAKEESIGVILDMCRLKQEGKIRSLIVTGCLSERFMGELLREIPEVDKYYGKFDYRQLVADLGLAYDEKGRDRRLLTTPRHYAYVKISEGCNRTCGYCAIPLMTGCHRSRPMEEIVAEVESLVEGKCREFQIIAQELTYYGLDLYGERRLGELLRRLAAVRGVRWLRLHYAYPAGFPMEVAEVMRECPNVCKYLDIALQHASDRVLRNMRRNTSEAEMEELIGRLREEVPGIGLRTTMMVGYPGETEEDFEELLCFVRRNRFERLGAFAYSEEEGTWAARNLRDDVAEEVKRERLDRLMAVQQEISEEIGASRIGQTLQVMVDGREGDYYVGRTEWDSPEVDGCVFIKAGEGRRLRRGVIYDVVIEGADEFDLYGSVAN